MGASAPERHVLEMPGDFGASRLQSRAIFLNLILNRRRHVISDLWEAALPEFKSVVLRHFHKEIFGDLDGDPDFPESKHHACLQAPRDHIA